MVLVYNYDYSSSCWKYRVVQVIILFGPAFLSWISPQIKLIITDDMPERKLKFMVQIGFIKFLQLLLLVFMSQKHRLQTRAVEYLFLIMLIFYVSNWWGGAAELIVLTVKYYYYYHHGIECLRKLIGSSLNNKVALYRTPETWLCSAWLRVQKDYVKISHMF